MTDNSQNNTPPDDDMLSQIDARKFERNVAIVGVIFFAVFCLGLWIVMKNVADGPLPPPSFVPTGDTASQSKIPAPKIYLPESTTRENRVEYAVPPPATQSDDPEAAPGTPAPPTSVIDMPQESGIDGAPPQPVSQPADTLQLKNPRHAYDLPVGPYDSDPKWRTVRGIVTAIAPRTDRMTDGSQRKNLYARTEFYIKDSNMNCFFHQYMGETATL